MSLQLLGFSKAQIEALVASGAATSGEGAAPASGLFFHITSGSFDSVWLNGTNAFDTTGTPADGSVTATKVAGANIDGAPGTPSMRTLDTDNTLAGNSDSMPASQKAVKSYVTTQSGLLIPKSLGNAKGDLVGFEATGKPVGVPAAEADGRLLGSDSTQKSGNRFFRRAEVVGVRPLKPASTYFLTPMHATRASTQQNTGNKNTMFLMPVDVAAETEYDRIACFVPTKGEGSGINARLGYYEDDGTGSKPTGAPLLDAGTVSMETASERFIEIAKKLVSGRYWVAWVMQGTVTTGPFVTTCSVVGGVTATTLEASALGSWKQTEVTGALPTIGTLVAAGTTPLVGLRVK